MGDSYTFSQSSFDRSAVGRGAVVINNESPVIWPSAAEFDALRTALAEKPSPAMDKFLREAETAAKQSNWERFKTAAKKIGEMGVEYLRDASIKILATLTAKALLG